MTRTGRQKLTDARIYLKVIVNMGSFNGWDVKTRLTSREPSERDIRFGAHSLHVSPFRARCWEVKFPSACADFCEHLVRTRWKPQVVRTQQVFIMNPSENVLQFHIASSCNESKEPSNVRAGWVALLRTRTCTIEFHRPLCLKCDNGRQTKLRALLRCMNFVATTAHEITKVGSREPENKALCDARPLGGDKFTVKILTPEKTGSLARLGRGLYRVHQDLHHSIQNISKCVKQLGVSLRLVWESEEDEVMKYAIDLADYAHEDAASAYCITCDFKCGGDFSPMIEHLKWVHLNRDRNEEAGRAAEFAGRHAWSICGICATAFLDPEELQEHRRQFH